VFQIHVLVHEGASFGKLIKVLTGPINMKQQIQSNLCTTTTFGTQKSGRY